jgi:hypothetical protein
LGIGPNPQSPIPNPQSPIPKTEVNEKNNSKNKYYKNISIIFPFKFILKNILI